MDHLDATTASTIAAAQGMWMQLSALAVTYAFSVMGAIVLIVLGYFVAGLAERAIRTGLKRIPGFDDTLRQFFSKFARYAILILVGITVLAQFGVQTASILAAIGAIGLAIGLALQGTLQNIAAGVMLLVLRPFRVGEYVTAGAVSGTVRDIGLFATEFKTYDGLYVLAPNSTLWNAPVTNFSRNSLRLNDLTIGIGYGDEIEHARETLLELARADARVLTDPAPACYVSELGDSAVSINLRYWTATSDWFATKNDLVRKAKQAFDEQGISIPFPQTEMHIAGSAGGIMPASKNSQP